MSLIVHRGESAQSRYNAAEAERAGDGKDRTEHQLRLHIRQGYIPQLLPTVLDAVHGTRFVKRPIHHLQAGNEGQERRTQRGPQCHDDTKGHYIAFVVKPLNRVGNQAKFQKNSVYITVRVSRKGHLPDHVHRTGNGGCIENQGDEGSHFGRQFIDEPCHQEGKQIGNRTCD